MKVAIFGGTGYAGSYIIDELINNDMVPRLLVREGSESKVIQPDKCEIVIGDIEDEDAINKTLDDCDVVIYLIALIREFPSKGITNERFQFHGSERVADLARGKNVNRFILMSANGARLNGTDYQTTKFLAEKYLSELKKSLNFNYSSFKSMIIPLLKPLKDDT